MPYIIDGKAISKQIKDELRDEVEKLTEAGINACLAVIQVGNDPASTVYVNNKKKACAYVGINSRSYELPEDTSEQTLLDLVQKLNEDPEVNGILVQRCRNRSMRTRLSVQFLRIKMWMAFIR